MDPPLLYQCHQVTEQEVRATILKLGPASSILDPLPTNIIKLLLEELLPDLTRLINASLASGTVPDSWKEGIITPLPKKEGIDISVLKNLRPVSQLRLLPRITEAIISQQLHAHLEKNNLLHDHQSGFRRERGTESATLDVREKMLWCADSNHPTLLILLDLSAAFDTVDHSLLIQRLKREGRIGGTALQWLESFLTNRHQQVKWQDHLSRRAPVPWGVPQGSSLSPTLFNIYLRPLAEVLDACGLRFQMFADDTQILVDLHESSGDKDRLAPCLTLLREWMRRNKLCLNPDKTELLLAGADTMEAARDIPWPSAWGSMPVLVLQARNLGVEFSHTLGAEAHVSKVTKNCHHQLNSLTRVFPFLTLNQKKVLYQASVGSRIRYGLLHLIGSPKKSIYTIQKIQNRAIRLILNLERRDHVSRGRQILKWLTINNQIIERACQVIWKARHGVGPLYSRHWAPIPKFQRTRRLPNTCKVALPLVKRARKGGRTLAVAGGRLWNNLPITLRQTASWPLFRKSLRDHLFNLQEIQVMEQEGMTIPPPVRASSVDLASYPPDTSSELGALPTEEGSDTSWQLTSKTVDRRLTTGRQGGRTGLTSPPLPTRNNQCLIGHAGRAKKLNTSPGGSYAPRKIP